MEIVCGGNPAGPPGGGKAKGGNVGDFTGAGEATHLETCFLVCAADTSLTGPGAQTQRGKHR